MKTITVLTLACLAHVVQARDQTATDSGLAGLLRDAIFAEEAGRDLAGAERGYRELLRRFDSERAYAGTAALRLAEVLNARGETEEAERLYVRVLREFGDQKAVAEVAKERLGDKAKVVGDAMAESKVNRLERILAESPDLLNTEVDGKTPLERAVEKGESDVVAYLIEKGVKVDGERKPYVRYTTGSVPVTPLAKAVAGGHLQVVELLIDAGATLYPGLLHAAAEGGHLAVAKNLIDKGMDVDARFPCDVLINGTEHAQEQKPIDPRRVRRVTREGDPPPPAPTAAEIAARPLDSNPEWNLIALEVAALRGFGEVARLFVSRGADVRGLEGEPSIALYHAIEKGDKVLVDALLAKGARPNGFWKKIGGGNGGLSPLMLAARVGHGAIARSLLAAGADLSGRDAQKYSALHFAKGSAVDVLIDAGADVNALADDWGPPLACIGREPHEVAKVNALLAAGADPNLMGTRRGTPLAAAVSGGHLEAVDALLEAGADVSFDAAYGSALGIAAGYGEPAMVERLLKAGAGPNRGNATGWTAFHSAVGYGQPAVVELLLKAGAKPNGPGGDSPAPITALRDGLDLSGEKKQEVGEAFSEKVRLLVGAGADVNAVAPVAENKSKYRNKSPRRMDNGMGEPVVFKAARWGDADLVRYLIAKGAKLEAAGEHVYKVVEKNNDELRAELFRTVLLDDKKRAGVLRVVLAERGEILTETAPLADEECSYSILEAFGFALRNTQLSSGEAKIWRSGSDEPITVNLRELAATSDPERDVPLQWGDVVEFQEPKDKIDRAFSAEELQFLRNHLTRSVTIRWINDAGEETANTKTKFGINTRSSIADSELLTPGYYPGLYYHVSATTVGVGYLVPLLELGGKQNQGNAEFVPRAWLLKRTGLDGSVREAEYERSSEPSPWLEDGDEIVFKGAGKTIRSQNTRAVPVRPGRRVVLPPKSR